MDLVLMPFLLLCIIAIIKSARLIYKCIKDKSISINHCIVALSTTLIIYGLIFVNYYYSETAYAFGAYFMFPFFMVIVPFLISRFIKNDPPKSLSNIFLLSVIFSGIFIIVFFRYTFDLVKFLKIPIHY